jgi:hypothetical protein
MTITCANNKCNSRFLISKKNISFIIENLPNLLLRSKENNSASAAFEAEFVQQTLLNADLNNIKYLKLYRTNIQKTFRFWPRWIDGTQRNERLKFLQSEHVSVLRSPCLSSKNIAVLTINSEPQTELSFARYKFHGYIPFTLSFLLLPLISRS